MLLKYDMGPFETKIEPGKIQAPPSSFKKLEKNSWFKDLVDDFVNP